MTPDVTSFPGQVPSKHKELNRLNFWHLENEVGPEPSDPVTEACNGNLHLVSAACWAAGPGIEPSRAFALSHGLGCFTVHHMELRGWDFKAGGLGDQGQTGLHETLPQKAIFFKGIHTQWQELPSPSRAHSC